MITDCVFCLIIRRQQPAYIIYEDDQTIAFLDKYPQTRGHLQLVPKTHVRWIYDLPDMGSFFTTAQKIIRAIIPILGAEHMTIATFGHEIKHAHLWIVPQYRLELRLSERRKTFSNGENLAATAALLRDALQGGGVL